VPYPYLTGPYHTTKTSFGNKLIERNIVRTILRAAAAAADVGRGGSSSSSRAVMKAHQEEMDGALALGGCHLATTHNNQL